jgi:hypothetical protein
MRSKAMPSTSFLMLVLGLVLGSPRRAVGATLLAVTLSLATGRADAADVGWQSLPGTKLVDVAPPDGFRGMGYDFHYHAHSIVDAWNGAIVDAARNRLILWGGGHNDYYGNEVYALNVGAAPATMARLNDPSPINTSMTESPAALADGRPNARHTYNNIVHLAHADRMFAFFGARAGVNAEGKEPGNGPDTWTLDLSTLQWQRMDPANGPAVPASFYGSVVANAAYDPNSKTVIMQWGSQTLWRYTYETNSYEILSQSAHTPFNSTGVIDPKRKLFIAMGTEYGSDVPHVYVTDISADGGYVTSDWSGLVVGCEALAGSVYPGLAYDPVLDRIVGWPGSGDTVYLFDPDTKTCTQKTFVGGPVPLFTNGTFGRFGYLPGLNAFAVVCDANQNASLLRLDDAPGVPVPLPPTSATGTTTAAGTTAGTTTTGDTATVPAADPSATGASGGRCGAGSWSSALAALGVTLLLRRRRD